MIHLCQSHANELENWDSFVEEPLFVFEFRQLIFRRWENFRNFSAGDCISFRIVKLGGNELCRNRLI